MAVLKVFAKVNGPQQMHKHAVLFKVFVALLRYPDAMAQLAFSALLRFKPDYLVPYADTLKQLFVKGKMRESMLELKEMKNDGRITREHRLKLVPILARILLGRVSAKNTTRSSKDSPAARRVAFFSFLAGFCEDDEVYSVVYLAIRQFAPRECLKEVESQTAQDIDHVCERLSTDGCQEYDSLPSSVHEGFLNVLEAIISQLGHHVLRFVPLLLSITLGLLEVYSIKTVFHDECTSEDVGGENFNSRSSRIRALCFRRLSELFDRFSDTHDFSKYNDRLWKCVDPSIKGLPESAASAERSPSLMIFLKTLSSNPSHIPVLQAKQEAVEAMVESLGVAKSNGVVDSILSFIENLLGEGNDDTRGQLLIEKHTEALLKSFENRMSCSENPMTLRREIHVLCGLSDLITSGNGRNECESSTLNSLAQLLLPYLAPASRLSEQDKSKIISVLKMLIPGLTEDVARTLYQSISLCLGPAKFGQLSLITRHAISETLYCLALSHFPEEKAATECLLELCSLNTKRIGELNYDSSISMLQRLSNKEENFSWICLSTHSTRALTPIIQICFQFFHDEDGVLARTSLKALRVLVEWMLADNDSSPPNIKKETGVKFLESHVLPLIRSGLQMKGDAARRFYIQLLAAVAENCKDVDSEHLHGDLALLMNHENPDLDFFQGICHVQIHRRAKALTRLRRTLEEEKKDASRFSLQSLSNVLLPLVVHPIYETKRKDEEGFAMEAIAAVGAIARLLSWSKYNNLIGTLLNQFQRHPEQEKFLVGAICSVLDNMEFDLSQEGSDASSAVMRTLERRIIPKTEELLTKEVKKSGRKEKTIRPSIVLALLKLAQRLPKEIFHLKLHRLLAVLCDALKNRDSGIREVSQ